VILKGLLHSQGYFILETTDRNSRIDAVFFQKFVLILPHEDCENKKFGWQISFGVSVDTAQPSRKEHNLFSVSASN
jgi:hypothetical protein